MRDWLRLGVCAVWLALAGCASAPQALATPPVVLLGTDMLEQPLALQQRLTVTAAGRTLQFDMALEADRDGVRMALLDMGQAVARLEWDGRQLTERRAPGWPAQVRSDRILADLQLVHWPVQALQSALPLGWTLTSDAGGRTLRHSGHAIVRVRFPAPMVAELDNLADGYRVRVESRAMGTP
jgi:hypothetical protein